MISFETAQRMKEAGFPQPDLSFGQVWYQVLSGAQSHLCFVGKDSFVMDAQAWARGPRHPLDALVFRPTPADILPLLPTTYRVGARGPDFAVWDQVAKGIEFAETIHKDMDEALALAWLALNEKSA